MKMNIYESAEDYLEQILMLLEQKGQAIRQCSHEEAEGKRLYQNEHG